MRIRPTLTYLPRESRHLADRFLASLGDEARVLNIGSGGKSYGSNVINLDVAPGPDVDVVGVAETLPFEDASFDGALLLAVLEHVADADRALVELRRVLRPGARALVAIPFIQGWHPHPLDRRRFTREGLAAELERHRFEVEETGIVNGPASAMTWVSAEFLALLLSGHSRRAYRLVRVATSWLVLPLKWLDAWLVRHEAAEVIASGVWARARVPQPGELSG